MHVAMDNILKLILLLGQITEESIFTYEAGESVGRFSNPDHIPPFLDELLTSLMNNSTLTAVCGDNVECLFDFDQTGDVEVGMAAIAVENETATELQEACKLKIHVCMVLTSCYSNL